MHVATDEYVIFDCDIALSAGMGHCEEFAAWSDDYAVSYRDVGTFDQISMRTNLGRFTKAF